MKKVQIFIEHDIIIRHFVHNRTFAELEKAYDVQYVFPESDQRVRSDVDALGLKAVVKVAMDRARLARMRFLSKVHTLTIARRNPAFRFMKVYWQTMAGPRTYLKMMLLSMPYIYPWYRRRVLARCGVSAELSDVIARFKPDVIIHPSVLEGLFISDLSLIAEAKGIPFVALMNSWDNPSTKGMIIKAPDWLVVWGEQTKRHAVEFLGVDPARVKKFGAAQFDVYKRSPSVLRREFCASLGVKEETKLILYAGSSKSFNEIEHLRVFEQAAENGALRGCHVVFRPHPWRAPAKDEPDFFSVGFKHITMEPSMIAAYKNSQTGAKEKMNLSDYMGTHNTLCAVDLLVSNVSTILLEAALHGKPVLCMVSDGDLAGNGFLRVVFNAIYFQELIDGLDLPRCDDHRQLPALCSDLLAQAKSPSFKKELAEKVAHFIEPQEKTYGMQLKEFVDGLVGNIIDRKEERCV